MGGAASLLSRRRGAALAGLLVALGLYDVVGGRRLELAERWDVALVSLVLLPAAFGACVALLPPREPRWSRSPAVFALTALAVLFEFAGLDGLFNVAKLLAFVLFGFWFLPLFEALVLVVVVALIIPAVDALSVWRGPTAYVVEQPPRIFERISIAFPLPGEEASANLGPPDVLFLSLFLGTAARFDLRVAGPGSAMTGLLA